MNILLVQPPWPRPKKLSESGPSKYFPFPLIKLASLYRSQGHCVALVLDEKPADEVTNPDQIKMIVQSNRIPFVPDRICFTTVFSYWFRHVEACVKRYMTAYPNAEIYIGGVHATLSPQVYREAFPTAYVHVGPVPEAEALEPAWDMLGEGVDTQILRFSAGCTRKCSFCAGWKYENYAAYSWEDIAPRIRFTKLILNDNNLLAHPHSREILKNLAGHRVGGKPITSVEVQGGFDVRILHKQLDIIPMMKQARLANVRLAWDGGMEMAPMVETCINALDKAGFHRRQLRCYMLYNHDLPFDVIAQKLERFEQWKIGPIHSRYRPVSILSDGYISQKKAQGLGEYYIHHGWTDRMVRIAGSLSNISKMVRAGVGTLNEVRSYYNKPSVADTLRSVAA